PKLTLQKTAFQLCKTINDITPITAKSIVSSVFLGSRTAEYSLEEILRLCTMLVSYVEAIGYPLRASPLSHFKRSAEQTVRRLQKSGVLTLSDEKVPRVYQLDRRKRNLLNFYKNNAIHCFVRPSILWLSFFAATREVASSASVSEF